MSSAVSLILERRYLDRSWVCNMGMGLFARVAVGGIVGRGVILVRVPVCI